MTASIRLVRIAANSLGASPRRLIGRRAMAKGQKKSNKEVRKPKAEKAKPAPAGSNFLTPPKK
jgi:hypothetical protein